MQCCGWYSYMSGRKTSFIVTHVAFTCCHVFHLGATCILQKYNILKVRFTCYKQDVCFWAESQRPYLSQYAHVSYSLTGATSSSAIVSTWAWEEHGEGFAYMNNCRQPNLPEILQLIYYSQILNSYSCQPTQPHCFPTMQTLWMTYINQNVQVKYLQAVMA